MKKKWASISIASIIAALTIISGCSSSTPDNQPWTSYATEVALKINMDEDTVFDAFEQAFEEGADIPSDRLSTRVTTLTDEDVEQIAEWYENRPEGCNLKWFNTLQYFGAEIGLLCSGSDAILDGLASRVASALGLDQQEVITAFHQVSREIADEMHRDGLDQLIEGGYLTEEQADQYYQWYLSRPDVITPGRVSPAQ